MELEAENLWIHSASHDFYDEKKSRKKKWPRKIFFETNFFRKFFLRKVNLQNENFKFSIFSENFDEKISECFFEKLFRQEKNILFDENCFIIKVMASTMYPQIFSF